MLLCHPAFLWTTLHLPVLLRTSLCLPTPLRRLLCFSAPLRTSLLSLVLRCAPSGSTLGFTVAVALHLCSALDVAPPLGEQIAPHWCLVRGIMSPVSSAVGGAPKNPDQLGDVLSCSQEPPLEVAHKWGGVSVMVMPKLALNYITDQPQHITWLCRMFHWSLTPAHVNKHPI